MEVQFKIVSMRWWKPTYAAFAPSLSELSLLLPLCWKRIGKVEWAEKAAIRKAELLTVDKRRLTYSREPLTSVGFPKERTLKYSPFHTGTQQLACSKFCLQQRPNWPPAILWLSWLAGVLSRQPLGIISALKTNSNPSLSYCANKSFKSNNNISTAQLNPLNDRFN